MHSEISGDAARDELHEAVRVTLATGSAKVRYTMGADPPDLADYAFGEGVTDFRARRARVAYIGTCNSATGWPPELVEQVTDGHVTYVRLGGPSGEWVELELGTPREIGASGDAGGFLELLEAPGAVARLDTEERFDDKPGRRYSLVIDPPRSSLRERLADALGVRGPSRFWLDAWTDSAGRIRRIAACDHAPNPDGTLPRGAVCTIVDFSDFGVSAPVAVPPDC